MLFRSAEEVAANGAQTKPELQNAPAPASHDGSDNQGSSVGDDRQIEVRESPVMGIKSFYFGGTAVLIVVGVALDTVHQIEAQLLMRHYDGILRKSGGKSGSLLRM